MSVTLQVILMVSVTSDLLLVCTKYSGVWVAHFNSWFPSNIPYFT